MKVTPFGFNEIYQKAYTVADGIDDRIEAVLDSASQVYIDAVKERAPRSMNSSRGTNYVSSIKILDSGPGYRIIGSDMNVLALKSGKTYNLGEILEMGTAAHIIEPILAEWLTWVGGKYGPGVHFGLLIHHPGTRPQPHYVPAIPELKEKFPNIWINITNTLWSK